MTKRILSFCLVFLSMVTATRTACAYYDPSEGRFISEDTYLGDPGNPPSLHRYLYAYSNPTVYTDLTGNMSLKDHRLTSKNSFEEAIDKGYFERPQDESFFRRNLQIGSMLPDVQYEEFAEANYLHAFEERLPYAEKIRSMKETIKKYKEQVIDGVKAVVKNIAPGTYLTVETGKHAWDDSDFKKPLIDKVAEVVPEVKDVDILRTHFYDKQWQHGMGEDAEAIRESLISDTVDWVISYKKFVKNGETGKAAQELGVVLHYVEDTWTPSHVARDEQGNIKFMFDYTKQSPTLHAEQDMPDHNSATMLNATKAGVDLLKIVQEHGNDPKEMRKQLMEKIYPLDLDKGYQNPYAPRVSGHDALDAFKNYSLLPSK